MSGPYADAAWSYREAGWLGILPLPPRQKAPVPSGWTGHAGSWPSGADIEAWVQGPEGAGNVALRLPPDIIGIDIDAYGSKQGGKTIIEAVTRWGSLPPTWRSTNRTRGKGSILLFAVPEGLAWPGEIGAGVEIIQYAHRYLVAPPSVHPEGRIYRWVSPDDADSTVPPEPGDVPALPQIWIDGITGGALVGEHPHAGFTGEEVSAWLNKYGGGWPCQQIERAVQTAAQRFTLGGSRHETARDAVRHIIALSAEGHRGGSGALLDVQTHFEQSIAADLDRPKDSGEFRRMVDGAVQLVGTVPVPEYDRCEAPLTVPYRETSQRSSRLLTVRNGAYLNDMTFPPLCYTVSELVPEGLTLLVGAPKIGKSFLVLDLALARASGGLALGMIPVLRGPVLYLALEDGDRRIQQRCRQLLGSEPIPELFEYTVEVHPAELLLMLGEWIDEHRSDTPLIILDTLGIVMPPAASGETTYQRDYRIARELKRLVGSAPGGALIVNHHDRKQQATDFIDAVSGTHGLAGAADTTIVVVRDRLSPEAVVKVTGRDVREGQYAMTFSDGRWVIDGESLFESEQTAASRRVSYGLGERSVDIIAYVARHDACSPWQVGSALGLSPKTAQSYLGRLVTAGRLERVGRGQYSLCRGVGSAGSVGSENS